jgi:O-antigen/teichoic acid export membrane protein
MNIAQRIAKNTAALTTAEIATAIIGFLFIMYVARYLGVEGFGILFFALAFTAIFGVLIDFGLSPLTIREVARNKALAKKYLGNIAVLKIILSIVTFGLITLTINLLGYPEQTINVVYLIALSVIFTAFSTMFYSIFQAYERMEFVTIGRILNSVLLLAGALFVIGQGLSVVAFASVYLFASAVTLGCSSIISTWKFAKPKIEVDLSFWKETLKQAWPFGLVVVSVNIYYWIDSVMLSLLKGDEVVGWYNAAFRLVLVLGFIPGAYFSSVFPVMSRFYVSSKESLRFTYEKSVKYMLLLAVPIGVGTTLLADKVILAIFGAEYSHSIIALQILIWSMVFIFVSGVFAQLFNSLNRQIIVAKVTGSCALLNVVLNLILIPKYSYVGASIATVATEFTALALAFIWSLRIGYGLSNKKLIDITAKVVIASAIMGAFIFYLRDLTLWGLVPLSAVLYFIVLYIIRGIDREDTGLLRQVVYPKA